MSRDAEDESFSESLNSAARDLGSVADAVGEQIQPLARLTVDTAHYIVSAVESTRAAGRDLWKIANILNRENGDDDALPERATDSPSDGDDSPVEPGSNILAATVRRISAAVPSAPAKLGAVAGPVGRVVSGPSADSPERLRSLAADLIARSQKPESEPNVQHPAFAKILTELTPDEARMLRFLAVAGPQPAIDIRTKTLFQIGSQRLASGVNMVAEMASCRWPLYDQHYFANLNRLGLVRFSTEPVDDFRRYALLEVQPRALEAAEKAKSTISIYRSIYLSPFGRQLCDVCFDLTGYTAGGWDQTGRGDKIIGSGPPDPAKHAHKH